MKRVLSFSTFLLVIAYGVVVFAHSTGITDATRRNGNGCTCHVNAQGSSAPSPNVLVTITGPDTLSVGERAEYAVTIRGGPAVRAGTNIAASAGSLEPISSSLQKFSGELTHREPTPFSGSRAEFRFSFVAPSVPGTATLYANGNSVNNNGNAFGDEWNFAPDKQIVIRATPTSIPHDGQPARSFSLAQNYPNPFNPETWIEFEMEKEGFIRLEVIDLLGQHIATLAEGRYAAGKHRIHFSGDNLPAGSYIYRLTAVNFAASRRMVLVR
jgi:hypothetical protein